MQAQLQQIRPHQKYDAEQILRDLNSIDIHERMYGPILNYKAFDQDLVLDGEKVKHTTFLQVQLMILSFLLLFKIKNSL